MRESNNLQQGKQSQLAFQQESQLKNEEKQNEKKDGKMKKLYNELGDTFALFMGWETKEDQLVAKQDKQVVAKDDKNQVIVNYSQNNKQVIIILDLSILK